MSPVARHTYPPTSYVALSGKAVLTFAILFSQVYCEAHKDIHWALDYLIYMKVTYDLGRVVVSIAIDDITPLRSENLSLII